MDSRFKRAFVVGVFSLLVFVMASAPSAFAAVNGTYDLNIWNNSASDGDVWVTIAGYNGGSNAGRHPQRS